MVDLKNSGCGALQLAARIGDCEVQSSGSMEKASHQQKKNGNAMNNMEEDLVYQNDVIFIIWKKILSILFGVKMM